MASRAAVGEVSSSASSGWMLPLLGIAAAIVCWSLGEDWREEVTTLTPQLKTAMSLAGRGSSQEIEALSKQTRESARQRRAIESRLVPDGDLEMVRAQLNSDLRRFCLDSAAKNCSARLADEALAARAATAGTGTGNPAGTAGTSPSMPARPAGLESLGVLRARGTISGLFETDEPVRLLALVKNDASRTWRINGVLVKGNTFEIDLERLILAPGAEAKP